MSKHEIQNVKVVSELNTGVSEYSMSSAILRIQLGFCTSAERSKCLIIDKIWRH